MICSPITVSVGHSDYRALRTRSVHEGTVLRQLMLRMFQSPGDGVMATAAVRDLHRAYPGQFQTDVRTSCDALWENNPYITKLSEGMAGVEVIDMQYPLIHECNRPFHFIHGYPKFLEERLGIQIPVTDFHGDIHLSEAEKSTPPLTGHSIPEGFWIIIAGGKYDFTAKWWNPENYQKVVDHFEGKIQFVQCGEAGHWHHPLKNVINLVGKTSTRQFVQLMYHADGVVCPVTFAMHLAAAVETPPGRPKRRACVVIAGGREPTHWEAYPHHRYLSTQGALSCCADGACWKSRCQTVGDGDQKDRHDLCEQPVQITPELRIPRCMDMITAQDVIRQIEMYVDGRTPRVNANHPVEIRKTPVLHHNNGHGNGHVPLPEQNVLLRFEHGLGDAVQFTAVLRHLRHYKPNWNIDVCTKIGKHTAFEGLCRRVYNMDREPEPVSGYYQRHSLDWHENHSSDGTWPETKVTRCLQEVFHLTPIPDLCRYEIHPSEDAKQRAYKYLESLCGSAPDANVQRFPAVLIHYEGNTSSERKNLPHELIREVCDLVLRKNHVPIILDWDRRSPLPDGVRIHNPHSDHELWLRTGTGDAGTMAALIEMSTLMIGVDSGPLHVAGATTTPTIGVWTHHHPIRYFDLADNVTHLVPANHGSMVAAPSIAYFQQNYRSQVYESLQAELPKLVEQRLADSPFKDRPVEPTLKATGYTEDYYTEHKRAGLDYLGFGDWQQQYGRWIVDSLCYRGRRMLDVGCACGSVLRGLGQAGAVAQGVDVCEPMIQMGRLQWPDMATLLHICDAVNLHIYGDESWDGIHSAQVAEHWKPELVPFILKELARVTVRGGLFFCALDTEELFARQNRRLETEDPTHICIKPMSWWHEQLAANGWVVCTNDWEPTLRRHPESFLTRYDWDWFVARKA